MTPFLSLCFLAAQFIYINDSVVTMREMPLNRSQVVSQAICSEKIAIEKEVGDWAYITTQDHYSGWINTQGYVKRDFPYETTLRVSQPVINLYDRPGIEYGPVRQLYYGTQLQLVDNSNFQWIKIALPDKSVGYIQKGVVESKGKIIKKEDLPAFSQKFLGLPYTWGGRSSAGYDCSGFVQMLYNQMGINFPRDARLQILDNRLEAIAIGDLEPSDLIFFGKSSEMITHVGMYVGDGKFIHTSSDENMPWLRLNYLSDAPYPYRTARKLITK